LISASKTFPATPRKDFGPPGFFSNHEPRTDVGFYATSLMSSKELLTVLQEHCLAIENGVHYRGDVNFEEERCRVKNR
jgi:predicted transposase YbfD/YdcC